MTSSRMFNVNRISIRERVAAKTMAMDRAPKAHPTTKVFTNFVLIIFLPIEFEMSTK